jgi:predicted Rossmann fold nucleotide-binding protein DprA/Smf involved in DNA uptake
MSTSELEISAPVSPNTQAILLLTAPLILGRDENSNELLTASEYKKLARFLYEKECQPSDLVTGGTAVGVLADNLERAALNRENRNVLRDRRLVLLSPYDPQAGFNIGNAMQRNKLIYALADAALVVQADHEKGGTWAGAIEQLDKLHLVPVYTLPNAQQDIALESLRNKGALTWPNPTTAEKFRETITAKLTQKRSLDTEQLPFSF